MKVAWARSSEVFTHMPAPGMIPYYIQEFGGRRLIDRSLVAYFANRSSFTVLLRTCLNLNLRGSARLVEKTVNPGLPEM